jgi:hypothetical protein
MANAIMRQRNWPRIMLMYFGARQVTSAAKGTILQAMEVPSVAKAKEAEAKKIPARDLDVYVSSRTPSRRLYGFQYAVPYMFFTADCCIVSMYVYEPKLVDLL